MSWSRTAAWGWPGGEPLGRKVAKLEGRAGEVVSWIASGFIAEERRLAGPICHAVSYEKCLLLAPSPSPATLAALTLASMEYYLTLIKLSCIRISGDTVDGPTAGDSLAISARRAAARILPLATIKLETIIRLYFLRHSFEYDEAISPVF